MFRAVGHRLCKYLQEDEMSVLDLGNEFSFLRAIYIPWPFPQQLISEVRYGKSGVLYNFPPSNGK